MLKGDAKVDINKYDEVISNLTKELESLRNQNDCWSDRKTKIRWL